MDRSNGIGGSDAGAILGISPIKSAVDLWNEKTGISPGFSGNMVTALGQKFEPVILELYQEETGRVVKYTSQERFNHPKIKYLFCHPDGIIKSDENIANIVKIDNRAVYGPGLLEIKYTSKFSTWGQAMAPPHFYAQFQHNLNVMGYAWGSFAVVCGVNFYWFDVLRDNNFIKNLMEAEHTFWHQVLTRKVPDVDGSESCKKALQLIWKPKIEKAIILNNSFFDIENIYTVARNSLKYDTDVKIMQENKIKKAMGENTIAYLGGSTFTWKPNKKGVRTFKYKKGGD